MKRAVLFSVVVLLVTVLALPGLRPAEASGNASYTFYCDAIVVTGTTDQAGVRVDLVVRGTGIPGTPTASQIFMIPGTGTRAYQVIMTYARLTNPTAGGTDSLEQWIWINGVDGGGTITEEYRSEAAVCEGLFNPAGEPDAEEDAPLPGCDVLIPIPEGAVGGTFTTNSELYWLPGEVIAPAIVMEPGKTVRVIGLDASGKYYKILYGCSFVWARAETLGPTFDAVWNGAPLPTAVVG